MPQKVKLGYSPHWTGKPRELPIPDKFFFQYFIQIFDLKYEY